MGLKFNDVFKIITEAGEKIYRVIYRAQAEDEVCMVCLNADQDPRDGGRPRKDRPEKKRKKPRTRNRCRLEFRSVTELEDLEGRHLLVRMQQEVPARKLRPLTAKAQQQLKYRKNLMTPFLDPRRMQDEISAKRNLGSLFRAAKAAGGSESLFRKLFTQLCLHGFTDTSLSPEWDKCGAPGVLRPCDPGGNKKAGAKPASVVTARKYGRNRVDPQVGMNTQMRLKILTAARSIRRPETKTEIALIREIQAKAFWSNCEIVDGEAKSTAPEQGTYPNMGQIRRVLHHWKSRLRRFIESTTKRNYDRNHKPRRGRAWNGVYGPGHRWVIDSTIADVFLRSAINPLLIIGRPVVYVISDAWSSAVVGFYVCLEGPSWAMAKVAIFSAAASPELIAELWGYQPQQVLFPAPSIPMEMLCDRGEYLSKAARLLCSILGLNTKFTQPYNGAGKGTTEILHRIANHEIFKFVPGAFNYRREEMELRKGHPEDGVLTMRQYVAMLHEIFLEYNLTNKTDKRLTTYMKAHGVEPNPAAMWNWGHAVGLGWESEYPEAELIKALLPATKGRMAGEGVLWGNQVYRSPIMDKLDVEANAASFGRFDVNLFTFPGAMKTLWTPDLTKEGLERLTMKGRSIEDDDWTLEEELDIRMFNTMKRAQRMHSDAAVHARGTQRKEDIVADAVREKAAAQAMADQEPEEQSIKEARRAEIAGQSAACPPAPPAKPAKSPVEEVDEHVKHMLELMRDASSEKEQSRV